MRRATKLTALATLPVVAAGIQMATAAEELKKPNVVWYMTEDTSPQYMGLYNDGRGGKSPRLEALAEESIVYSNAFSNAPVSSAARTTLITGCYAPRFGGSLHRRLEYMSMPEGLNMFPSYLRAAGYFTGNSTKTDYNVNLDETAWSNIKAKIDGWREREDPDQPFFFVRTNGVTHESKLLFDREVYETVKTRTNPEDVYVHPLLPDTELMKYTYATFYDRIQDSDDEFGEILDMLEEDGLMDDTFVFYFGDNGGSLPESKGYTMDVGFRVPLVVYVPEKWRKELGVEVGEFNDGMVSFMDFGATVLNLAGIELPEQMNGVPFLGEKSKNGSKSVMCYGDRYDDIYAFNRVLYRGDFRYARNYTPYHTRGMHAYYRYKSLALQEAREMFYAGELNENQAKFFEPMGAEELYDLKNDPNELNNLANNPKYASTLKKMRTELASKVDGYADLGFLPETIIHEEAMPDQAGYGEAHKSELSKYRQVADLQILPYDKASAGIVAAINSNDDVEKWWGLASAISFGDQIKSNDAIISKAQAMAKNSRSFLQVRANVLLAKNGLKKLSEAEIKSMLKSSKTLAETLLVLNDLVHLKEAKLLPNLALTVGDVEYSSVSVEERIKYLNL